MKNLKMLRERAKLTQEQVAKMMGVSQSTVTRWEVEKNRYPAGKYIPKLANVLRCKIEDFYA